jgi:hypothetical protein
MGGPIALIWSHAVDPQQVAREAPPRYGEVGKQCNPAVQFRASKKRRAGQMHPRATSPTRYSGAKHPICPPLFIHRNCFDCI